MDMLWLDDQNEELMRAHVSISARHNMLLRDENLRYLQYSDCFSRTLPKSLYKVTQKAVEFFFRMDKGKTNHEGQAGYACAVRYKDVRRCAFSAFAFLMFRDLQVKPSFLSRNDWRLFKVLSSDRTRDKESVSSTTQIKDVQTIFDRLHIYSTKKTHSGRHAGTLEAERLGVSLSDIKAGGRWQDRGRVGTYYMTKLPERFAVGTGGYFEEPCHLARNRVTPDYDLQAQIFPWIEGVFDAADGSLDMAWRKECKDMVNEIDENEVKEMVVLPDRPPGPSEDESKSRSKGKGRRGKKRDNIDSNEEAATVATTDSDVVAMRAFLKLLMRCRRVILQDAAFRLIYNYKNNTLRHPVFCSPEFEAFQKDVKDALTVDFVTPLEKYQAMVPDLVHQLGALDRQVINNTHQHHQLQDRVARMQQDFHDQMARVQQELHAHRKEEQDVASVQHKWFNEQHCQHRVQQAMLQTLQWQAVAQQGQGPPQPFLQQPLPPFVVQPVPPFGPHPAHPAATTPMPSSLPVDHTASYKLPIPRRTAIAPASERARSLQPRSTAIPLAPRLTPSVQLPNIEPESVKRKKSSIKFVIFKGPKE